MRAMAAHRQLFLVTATLWIYGRQFMLQITTLSDLKHILAGERVNVLKFSDSRFYIHMDYFRIARHSGTIPKSLTTVRPATLAGVAYVDSDTI